MIQVFSSQKCKEIDKKTIEEVGIPGLVLMENAARSLADELSYKNERFLIFCGKGNNGGDGLALARHLIMRGKLVKVYIVSKDQKYTKDFEINYSILKKLNCKVIPINDDNSIDEKLINDIREYENIIDGIFGVGLNREINGIYKRVIESINKYGKNIISIDVPSGLNSDSGIVENIAVKANVTYTFEVIKKGFLSNTSMEYIGDLKVLKIGIPDSIKIKSSEKFYILEKDDYKSLIPERKKYGHKGNYGRALIAAGSMGFTGAAYITTECTVRSGAGLTTLICDKEIQDLLSSKLIEAMTINSESDQLIKLIQNADSIAFGPGIGTSEKQKDLLKLIIEKSKCPLIIDADGITILANNKELFKLLKGRCLITPHPGEMSRLTNIPINEIELNRESVAKKVAAQYEIMVLLKGHKTIITDGKTTYANPTGNSKMASGGMGDALTGIINGFVSQGLDLMNATLLSAYLHGYIADELSKEVYIVNARDIIEHLPEKINKLIDN